MGVARKLCMMFGLAHTSAIDGSIIGTTTPLLVLILSVVVGIDRFTKMKVLGLMLGMAGTLAIILSSGNDVHTQSSVWGNMLIFISSCVSASYMVLCKRLVGKYRVTTVLRWIYCTSALVMLPIGIDDMLTMDFSGMDTKILLASLFVLIVPTYLPNLLLNYSLRSIAPTASSIYAYIQPVVAVGLSVAMKLDKLHPDTLLFAVVIFIGVGLVVGSYRKRTPKTTNEVAQR
jgi:drug/metabolite transporter (DMT)-like permease